MLSGRGLCDGLITRPEESYRLCCVVVCDLETSRMGAPYIYIYDISRLRVKRLNTCTGIVASQTRGSAVPVYPRRLGIVGNTVLKASNLALGIPRSFFSKRRAYISAGVED